jgi:HrpA-like RNA helicase
MKRLEKLAPDRIGMPGGKFLKVQYGKGREPVVSGRIQELYGLEKTPRIGDGKVEVTVEILGPNRRPLQVTRDLGSFWKETYPKLKGREPVVSGRIQELYGLEKTPRIGDGKVEVTVEILGPNRRPLQVTRDLGSFWKETYPKLKGELARKYPKHEWR